MTALDKLAEVARAHNLRIPVPGPAPTLRAVTSAVSLFYEPILALVVLAMVPKRGDLRVREVATWAAATLANCYFGVHTDQRLSLESSTAFRERCANAVTILETLQFVVVESDDERIIRLTERGANTIKNISQVTDEAGLLARRLSRSASEVRRIGLRLL